MEQTEIREKFYKEYNDWVKETSILSVGIYENEHFDNIVKLGKDTLPYLIEVLEKGPNHLVHACDLIFPGIAVYEGYVPLDDACSFWLLLLKLIQEKGENNIYEISEQNNQA